MQLDNDVVLYRAERDTDWPWFSLTNESSQQRLAQFDDFRNLVMRRDNPDPGDELVNKRAWGVAMGMHADKLREMGVSRRILHEQMEAWRTRMENSAARSDHDLPFSPETEELEARLQRHFRGDSRPPLGDILGRFRALG